MATLTGKTIANTYKDLLQVSNNNGGVDGTLRTVSDGEGTNSPLQLSNSAVNINGTFQLNGNTLTATASALNAVTDLSGVTGLVAMTGGTPLGRSIAVGTGLSVTNADGVAGNPTVELDSTSVVAGSYGPVSNFAVNAKGQVVSASTPVSVSIATIRTSELVADNVLVSSNVSVKGDVLVSGGLEVLGDVSSNHLYATSINVSVLNATEITVSILNLVNVSVSTLTANQLVVTQKASVSSLNVVGKVSGTNAVFSGNVSASAFYGDGSNLTNLPTAPVSVSAYTVNVLTVVSAATVNGIISATNFVGGGAGLTNVSAIFAASATNATNAENATSAVFASSATNATNAVSAVFATSATNATNAVNATNATSAVFASSATNATNAVNATNATSAVFASSATNATIAVNVSGSGYVITSAGFFSGSVSVSSAIVAGAGTVNAPSYSTTGDTNTGLYFPAADTIAVATSGTERMRITSAGLVGIGTSLPNSNALLTNNGNIAIAAPTRNQATSNQVGVWTSDDPADNGRAAITIGTVAGGASSNSYISFTTNNYGVDRAERMRIDSSGNVGIGTTGPSGRLDVRGSDSATFALFAGTAKGVRFNIDSNVTNLEGVDNTGVGSYQPLGLGGSLLQFSTGATERMRIDSSGNVGIGTSSPSYRLQTLRSAGTQSPSALTRGAVLATTYTRSDNSDFVGRQIGIGVTEYASFIQAEDTSLTNSFLALNPNGGNVGIGTASPGAPLQVVGAGRFGASPSQSTGACAIYNDGNNATIEVFAGNNSATKRDLLLQTYGGNVGIGTSSPTAAIPLTILSNSGNAIAQNIRGRSDGIGVLLFSDNSDVENGRLDFRTNYAEIKQARNAPLVLSTNATERMRIDSSGNVGIGTSSPLKQLEITKSARAVITSLTDATSISVDFNTAQNFAVMLTGNRTLENPTNCVAGQTGSIFVMQNVSGGKTLSFGSNWKFAGAAAPTLTTTASAVDRIDYIVFTSTAIQAVATLDVR